MRIFRRALIFSTPFAQNFSTFCQNFSGFGEKYPTFSAPLRAALATRHKKRTAPQFIVQSFVFQSKHEAAFPPTSRGSVYLVAPVATSKALFTAFCAPFAAAALALFTAAFAPLSTAFTPCCAAALALVPTAFARFSTALAPF